MPLVEATSTEVGEAKVVADVGVGQQHRIDRSPSPVRLPGDRLEQRELSVDGRVASISISRSSR